MTSGVFRYFYLPQSHSTCMHVCCYPLGHRTSLNSRACCWAAHKAATSLWSLQAPLWTLAMGKTSLQAERVHLAVQKRIPAQKSRSIQLFSLTKPARCSFLLFLCFRYLHQTVPSDVYLLPVNARRAWATVSAAVRDISVKSVNSRVGLSGVW